jgi:ribosomal protein S12 methylthiotransferase
MEAAAPTTVRTTPTRQFAATNRKRAYVFNTGCIRRALDSTRIYEYLLKNGWTFTNNIGECDLVIVSTCSAVNKSEELSTVALRYVAKKLNKRTKLIITGCLPKVNPELIRATPGLGIFEFVPTGELERLDDVLGSDVRFKDVPDANMVTNEIGLLDYVLAYRLFRHSFFLKLYKRMSANRVFLKSIVSASESYNGVKRMLGLPNRPKIIPYYNLRIAEGCAFNCAYCCIKFATGKVKSKPIDEIVGEFEKGLAEGHKVFQLVCEDVGCYGVDTGSSIVELLRALLAVEGDYQLVMIDFGGHWLVKHFDELMSLFRANPYKIKELYVALQSGSDKILKAMKRPEQAEPVQSKLIQLKSELPHMILRTTVIIGFPGETQEDFEMTVEAIKRIPFEAVELNPYEDRPGTASSMMANKIPAAVVEARIAEISQYC